MMNLVDMFVQAGMVCQPKRKEDSSSLFLLLVWNSKINGLFP